MDKEIEKFSYSKISTYEDCPYRYKLVYEDKHYINDTGIATEFGTLVHFIEETMARTIIKYEPLDYIKLSNMFLDGCEDETGTHIPGVKELQQKYPKDFYELDKSQRSYADKANDYLSTGIYRLRDFLIANPDYEIIGIEEPFNVNFEGYTFHGFIDRVFKDVATNEIYIEDIKTYNVAIDEKKLKTPLQFVVYSLAAVSLYNTSIDLINCAYELPLCNIKQSAGTKGFIERGKKKLSKIFASIEANEFEPNPTPLCAFCPFSITSKTKELLKEENYLCPYHSLWTRKNKTFDVKYHWMGWENHDAIMEEYKKDILKEDKQKKTLIDKFNSNDRILLIRR